MSPTPASTPDPQHEVAVIGAGLSGIGMGIALRRAGIKDFVILERAGDVGGTWRDNTYPGVAVDIPAQAYQFSYELNPDWSGVFARGEEVQAYIQRTADRYEVRPHIRFHCDVRERVWDAEGHFWRLLTGDGEVTARFVVSAIGPFVEPKKPDFPGLDDFQGKILETANWDHSYDLEGKRVAIIGTGASAVQIVPKIARIVERLDVYQRTPIWVAPRPNPRTPSAAKTLFRRVPAVQNAIRRLATSGTEFIVIFMVINHRRLPFIARGLQRSLRTGWYRSQVPDAELRAKLTPAYGFGCKRPAVSNTYLRAFNRDNVDLITDPIERVTAAGLRTQAGHERPVDAMILATGFRLSSDPENYRHTPVRGRDGFDLATSYERDRLASYEGISLPKLPNHFIMFGPYGWTGGTWHNLVETTSAHIIRVIQEAERRDAVQVEVTQEATDRWTKFVRNRLEHSLWNTNNCESANSYYFDHHGDTPFLRPTSAGQARRASRGFPLSDYVFETNGNGKHATALSSEAVDQVS